VTVHPDVPAHPAPEHWSYRVTVRSPLPDPARPGTAFAPDVIALFAEIAEHVVTGADGHVGSIASFSDASLSGHLRAGDSLDVQVEVEERGMASWNVSFVAHKAGACRSVGGTPPSRPVATAVTTVVRQVLA
jgi:hypothetical protein